jgi:hypothetical protein
MSDGVHAAITPRKNACTVSMHLVPTMGGVSDPFGRLLLIVHKVDLNTYADSSQIVAAKEKSQIFLSRAGAGGPYVLGVSLQRAPFFIESSSRSSLLLQHDLFRKPVARLVRNQWIEPAFNLKFANEPATESFLRPPGCRLRACPVPLKSGHALVPPI